MTFYWARRWYFWRSAFFTMSKPFFICISIFRTFSTFFTTWSWIMSFITFITITIASLRESSSWTFSTFGCSNSWRSSSRTYSTFFRFWGRKRSACTLIALSWSNSRIISSRTINTIYWISCICSSRTRETLCSIWRCIFSIITYFTNSFINISSCRAFYNN